MEEKLTAGQFLRKIREVKGEKQKEVSMRGNYCGAYISQIETGAKEISFKNIDRIMGVYQLTEDQRKQLLFITGILEEEIMMIRKIDSISNSEMSDLDLFYHLMKRPKKSRDYIVEMAKQWDLQNDNCDVK